jgi:hypothetical protein
MRLASAGVDIAAVEVAGQGVVQRQRPEPGALIEGGVDCKIVCEWL